MYKVRVIVDDPFVAFASSRPFVATAPASRMWCVSNRFGVSPAPMVGHCYVACHFPQRTHKNKAASLDATRSCVSTSPRVSRCATIEPQNTITSPRENVSHKSAVGFVTFFKSCAVRTIFFATFSKSCAVFFQSGFSRVSSISKCNVNRGDRLKPHPIILYLLFILYSAFIVSLISLCTHFLEHMDRCKFLNL